MAGMLQPGLPMSFATRSSAPWPTASSSFDPIFGLCQEEADAKSVLSWVQSKGALHMDQAMKVQEGSFPEWDGHELPGQFALRARCVGAPELFAGISEILQGVLAAEVEELSPLDHRILATAFVDYVAVGLEARVVKSADGLGAVLLQSASRLDVVRFRHLVELMAFALEARGLKVEELLPFQHEPSLRDLEFDSDDELGWDESLPWSENLRSLLSDALNSPTTDVREEAAQALATWARTTPACLLPMAQAMAEQSEGLLRHLQASKTSGLAEAYPLAAALRMAAASSPEASATLARPMRRRLQALVVGASRLVGAELSEASRHMDMCSVA